MTGIRVGELIRLDRDDVDFANHVLVVRHSKLGKSREVPLDETTLEALGAYLLLRDQLFTGPTGRACSSRRPAPGSSTRASARCS